MGFFEDLYERRQRLVESLVMAVALPAVAGAVNAAGWLVVGKYTSHVTGMAANTGDELAVGRWALVWPPMVLIAAFFFGAFSAAVFSEISRKRGHARYVLALIVESLLIACFAAICAVTPMELHQGNLALAVILAAAMGLQNALVTSISGAVVRTTHMTGVITDLGVECARLYYLAREDAKGMSIGRKLLKYAGIFSHVEAKRLTLLTTIFISFLAGAIAGPLVFLAIGYLSVIVPCGVLLLLAFVDYKLGLDWHPEVHLVPAGRASNPRFLQMVAAEAAANPEKARKMQEALRAKEQAATVQAAAAFNEPVVLDHTSKLPKPPAAAEAVAPKA